MRQGVAHAGSAAGTSAEICVVAFVHADSWGGVGSGTLVWNWDRVAADRNERRPRSVGGVSPSSVARCVCQIAMIAQAALELKAIYGQAQGLPLRQMSHACPFLVCMRVISSHELPGSPFCWVSCGRGCVRRVLAACGVYVGHPSSTHLTLLVVCSVRSADL